MYMNRAGEDGHVPGRKPRFFRVGEEWYFHTREGAPMGPFNDLDEAEQGLHDFLEFLALADPAILSRFYASLQTH
ncbi:MAG: DUF6316 family protein [Spongiibacteraceae bacterium]|jgi:hypothetical protein|nr:DUF6316 family protein [Spongiibacteraceae bacterium]